MDDVPYSIAPERLRDLHNNPAGHLVTFNEISAMAEELLTLRILHESTLPTIKTALAQRDRAQERVTQLETLTKVPSYVAYRKVIADRDEAESKAAELAERVPDLETERDEWRDRAVASQIHRDKLISARITEWGVRFEKDNTMPTMETMGKAEVTETMKVANRANAEAAVRNGAPISGRNQRLTRRFVTEWEEIPYSPK